MELLLLLLPIIGLCLRIIFFTEMLFEKAKVKVKKIQQKFNIYIELPFVERKVFFQRYYQFP